VHQRARVDVVLGRAALDDVCREGERRPGETDQRSRTELGDGERDGLADRLQCGVEHRRVQRGEAFDIRRGAHGRGQHRALTGHDLHLDADELERYDDVAEQDAGVDTVPADGLQGDLAGHAGVEARVEHPGSHPQLAVLGQRSAGLAHEPHGGHGGSGALVGPDQAGVGRASGGKWVELVEIHPVNCLLNPRRQTIPERAATQRRIKQC
jgi:hypothetical protein